MRRFSVDRPRCEYLVVPQITTGVPGAKSGFRLGGDTILPATAPFGSRGQLSAISALRNGFTPSSAGRRRAGGGAFDPVAGPRLRAAAVVERTGPPAMNNRRVFRSVRRSIAAIQSCGRARARRQTPGRHLRRFARPRRLASIPRRSTASRECSVIGSIPPTRRRSGESDIDSNTVVMVLMTNTVNKLVSKTTCQNSGFVAGFLLWVGLDPQLSHRFAFNKGEVF